MHYRRTGGSKPPLVLLHGLAASGACWAPLARSVEDGFDVLMPDARGHGKSSAPLHGYRYPDHADDVMALMRRLELITPIVLGHSMGGLTAALIASRASDAIGGVILVDPTFISPQRQREVRDSDIEERHRRTLHLDKPAVVRDIAERHPHRPLEVVELLAEARLQTRMGAFDVLTPPNPDYCDLVRRIRVPILLVTAGAGVVSRDTARELQLLNPRVRIEHIQGAAHGIPFDEPERLAAAVKSFRRFAN